MKVRQLQGFSMVELGVILAIVGVLSIAAAPSISAWVDNQRLKGAARSVASAIAYARGEAIRTGNIHIAFFDTDVDGNTLTAAGTDVPILVLNDGAPGSTGQNCKIDAGEPIHSIQTEIGVSWGVTGATASVTTDAGAGPASSGWTFRDQSGNDVHWVLFQPQGVPAAMKADCSMGSNGSGAGGVYLTNGSLDKAILVTPLGTVRVHTWLTGAWSA